MKRVPIEERFRAKVEKHGPDECWPWTGAVNGWGYGKFGVGGKRGGWARAHRVSWELRFGVIPQGSLVLHRCDNPPCVNPGHLFLGTTQDNMTDAIDKGRNATGESMSHAKLSPQKVRAIRSSGDSGVALARRFAVSESLVSAVRLGQVWKHI